MKKLLTVLTIGTMVISFMSCTVSKTWPTALGNASFATDNIWTISGNGIIQIWSDAVQTDLCSNKTTFDGGDHERSVFHISCRSNPDFPGDLFSWQAVYELRNELCPYPWRVPTVQDFIDLDIALGGTGESRLGTSSDIATPEFVFNNYITGWGGAFGGLVLPDASLHSQGLSGTYWSQTEHNTIVGLRLGFSMEGHVTPHNGSFKDRGFSLRCVR
ncbi:MAG: fibrobacter succinogenes major paralogous domain-containing protein [Bacteroidales bacterium]|nr:fibrobacter succinogenes major paralogous domain-containing protein [Bacteroidales bacterium]